MTVPESARSIGTFPLGLIMLDNIKTGKDTADEAFLPNADMVGEVEKRVEARKKEKTLKTADKKAAKDGKMVGERAPDPRALINTYRDNVDLGGTYAPAFSGSKPPLNQMEPAGEADKLELSTVGNKEAYYWNETLKRYREMVKKFLEANPALLSIDAEMDEAAAATDALIEKILAHFGIGEGIVTDTTRKREVARTTNVALHDFYGNMTSSYDTHPATPGSPVSEYQALFSAQHQDIFNDRAFVKERSDDQEPLKKTFHPKKQNKALERRKKEKQVIGNTIVNVEKQKRERVEKKDATPGPEQKKVKVDYKLVAARMRLENSISEVVISAMSTYGGESDPEVIFNATKEAVLVIYGALIDELTVPPSDVDAMIKKALDPFFD